MAVAAVFAYVALDVVVAVDFRGDTVVAVRLGRVTPQKILLAAPVRVPVFLFETVFVEAVRLAVVGVEELADWKFKV